MSLKETNFKFPGQQSFYRGKVRDVYIVRDHFISIASDRISAFDHILPAPIPHKGQVLNQIAQYFLEATSDIVDSWLIATPDPNVSIGLSCEPIKIEMVIRGYLAGHAWREYKSGKRILCGESMPNGMIQNDAFPEPIITPATKEEEGHDEDISKSEIIRQNIVSKDIYEQLELVTKALFKRGQEMANERGLILVDTKYEFGIYDGRIILIDEIHTPDSSRYFYMDGYEERQKRGEIQPQLSKEFVREWLMSCGFQGKEGQRMPAMPDSFIKKVTDRYITLYTQITGKKFIKAESGNMEDRIHQNILKYLEAT